MWRLPSTTAASRVTKYLPVGMALIGAWVSPAQAQQKVEWMWRSSTGPTARNQHAMAYDARREVTVLFGGVNDGGPMGDTWEWNGGAWHLQSSGPSPSPRYRPAMAYDKRRGVIVLFGGYNDITTNGETWEWNGTDWTKVAEWDSTHPDDSPSPRFAHAMAYDSLRGVTVLFGGLVGQDSFVSNGETWEWNGTSWSRIPVDGPSARHDLGMAYDSNRNVTVLFGGFRGLNENLGDTWEWSGSDWMPRCFTCGPSPRHIHAVAYDAAPSRRVTVLFGGSDNPGGGHFGDTWEWEGISGVWTRRCETCGPASRNEFAMAYDEARKETVLFGGYDGSASFGDTWALALCHADLNHDGVVDFVDFLVFLNLFIAQDPAADFTRDGLVDFSDYLTFLNLFDAGC